MAFTTVTGSNGITSLVGTTGVDTATIVSLNDKVFVGGNKGNDTLVTALGTGSVNLSDYEVRMGGGNDGVVQTNNLLNSFISLDGEVLANDGNDVYSSAGSTTVNSEIVGRGGNDAFTLGSIQSSIINGNSGVDTVTSGNVGGTNFGVTLSNATILGGQGSDIFTIGAAATTTRVLGSGNNINGNLGDDQISVNGATLASTTLFGGQGQDTITLASSIDGNTLSGDIGADTLTGGAANDILLGGQGNDLLVSAAGTDTLTGGDGIDVFTVGNDSTTNMNGTTDNYAKISDFVTGTETINVALNTATAAGTVDATGSVASTTSSSLFNNLTTAATNFNGTDVVQTVTLTGGNYAGTYILIQNGGASTTAFDAADVVIQANIAGLTVGNINLV